MAKSVLVVDDSASVRQVVGIALKSAGYDVIEASDGKDALGKLTGQKVHLIISDVNMPNMDGITFVKEVKKLASYKVADTETYAYPVPAGNGRLPAPVRRNWPAKSRS